jgi:hypothetical protein
MGLSRSLLGRRILKVGMFKGYYYQGFDKTELIESVDIGCNACYFRVKVKNNEKCQFAFSEVGTTFQNIGFEFKAISGVWIGAKVGIFSVNLNMQRSNGYSDFDWFKVEDT